MVSLHGLVDTRRDEDGYTAFMLTGSRVPLLFKQQMPASVMKGAGITIRGRVERIKGRSGTLALADCELVR